MLKWVRRAAALCVVALSALPLHRVLTADRIGPWGAQAIEYAERDWGVTFWGTLVVLLVALLAAVLSRPTRSDASGGSSRAGMLMASVRSRLLSPRAPTFALATAALAGVLALALTVGVQRLLLTNVDEMSALIHARYLAAGHLAGPLPGSAEAWLIPNMLVVDAGWVSQYPPGHLLILAGFTFAGVHWLMGPLLFASMVGLSAASFERLLPTERRALSRAAALLLAVSPFCLLLASGELSHLTAGAAGALALYASLRVPSEGKSLWPLLAGAAMGLMVIARPWMGLVLGPALTLGVWWLRGGWTLAVRCTVSWVAGGLPFALLLFAYDSALFGGPLTLGYEALYGPAHRLGFHADPWAFPYGAREAVGYSASDIQQFGATLLDTPVSVTLVAALYLLLAPRLEAAVGAVAAWALLPVFGNALYWFHQPRMLFESSPAWILLAVLGVAALYERSGRGWRNGVVAGAGTSLLVGALAVAPSQLSRQGWSPETLSRIKVPEHSADDAVVFVHASWEERTAALLQAAGMRNDSIQAILRRNDACELYEYALARDGGADGAKLPQIDLEQSPSLPATIASVRTPGDAVVLQERGTVWPAECGREVLADRFGSIALAPLLWQGDLPGLEVGRPLYVRDYGPARNATVLAHFPTRSALVFSFGPDGGPPRLLSYEDGMRLLWGPAGGAP